MSERESPRQGEGLSPSPLRFRPRRRPASTTPPMMEMLEGRTLFAAGIATGAVPWLTPRIGVGNPTPTPPTPPTPTPPTPTPTPPTPTPTSQIGLSRPRVVINDVRGGTGGSSTGLTIRNTGSTPLTISGLALTGGDAGQFSLSGGPAAGSQIPAGGSANVTVTFTAPAGSSAGTRSANLAITSSDALSPTLDVPLRGIATIGEGGQNEPSLQRIFDAYGLGVRTGDANAGNTNLYSNSEPLTANDEVRVQELIKDGSGPVTITPLGVFADANPSVRFGYYTPGNGGARNEVFTVTGNAQTVNPTINGQTSFDPGSGAFGIYANFPIFNNTAFSEDELNAAEQSVNDRRKVRFYPLTENGAIVPNAFVFTSEDFVNGGGAYDTNDFIGIIRNVRSNSSTGQTGALRLQNLDGVPADDWVVFSRVEKPTGNASNKQKKPEAVTPTSPNQFKELPTLDNVVKDTGTVRLTNTGGQPITINSIVLSNSTWKFDAKPADNTVLQSGQSADIKLRFDAHGLRAGHTGNETIDPRAANAAGSHTAKMTITTTDPTNPVREVTLAGWWQRENEKNMEPALNVLVTKLFGYKTVTYPNGTFAGDGKATPVGEEVVSGYWRRADTSKPVTVRQLVAYHGQPPSVADPEVFAQPADAAQLEYHIKGGSRTGPKILNHDPDQSQTVLPLENGSPAAGSFSTNSVFGFHLGRPGNEWSDDALNAVSSSNPDDAGHHMRFFPMRDQQGNLVPDTYLLAQDYAALNFDFQDNVYLVTNIKPENA